MGLIQDIIPASEQEFDTTPAYQRGYGRVKRLRQLKTETLVTELHKRGVSIEDIFGMYYALEAILDAHDDDIFGNDEEGQHGTPRLTVGDALLATGLSRIDYNQPF